MWKKYFNLHFIIIIWGFTAILGMLVDMPVLEMVFFRVLISALGLWLVSLVMKKSTYLPSKSIFQIMGNGSIIALHWLCFFGSARLANASISLVSVSTTTLFIAFMAPIFFKTKLKLIEVILGILIIIGICIIFFIGNDKHHIGLVIGLLAAIFAAIFNLVNYKLVKKYSSFLITLYEMTGAVLLILLFFPIYTIVLEQPIFLTAPLESWGYIIILALICTVYPFFQLVDLLKVFSPFYLNLTMNLEPIYGIIFAFLILKETEHLNHGFFWGTALILISVFIRPIFNKLRRIPT